MNSVFTSNKNNDPIVGDTQFQQTGFTHISEEEQFDSSSVLVSLCFR